MNKNVWFIISGIIVLVILGVSFFINSHVPEKNIRVGYMITWAEGSLPVQAMRNGGVAEGHNLNLSYVQFQYGPPLIEAALSKQVDVLFTGWVPAINLMTKSDDWLVVAKLNYFPMALMARNGYEIYSVKGLENKKIGVPYGSGLYPVVVMTLKENGLVPGKNVELVNMQPVDMAAALKSSRVDAVAWAEPSITILNKQNLTYNLVEYNDISFIVFSKSFVQENPEAVKNFLEMYKDSQLYISKNKQEVFKWFSEESQYDLKLINSLNFTDPNFNADSIEDISLEITPLWINLTQQKIDFEFNEKIIDKRINLSEKIYSFN